MATKIYALGHTLPVCNICGREICDHVFPKPRCSNCGRPREDHVGDDHKCLFEPTCYEPLQPLFSTVGWIPETWESLDAKYPHKTRGGVGAVGRLRKK